MNGLALDTSTLKAAVALERSDGVRSVAPMDTRRHGQGLLPAIRDLLRSAGFSPRELGAIGVGLGPGSYTGLRVGITAAKSLAYATGAKLVGLDSLEFFARSAPKWARTVWVLSDAQRGDFHAAEFRRESEGGPLLRRGETRIAKPDELRASWVEGPITVLGPGLSRWTGDWPEGVEAIPDVEPDPRILLEMLGEAIERGESADPFFLEPIYLRRSAAEDQWKKK